MQSRRYRPVRHTANWVFITKTRGVEAMNVVLLMATVAAFAGADKRIVALPMGYNADSIDTWVISCICGLLALGQTSALFALDCARLRYLSVIVLMVSTAMWLWLATITYYSADWLAHIGVHKQLFSVYIGFAIMCWLAASYISDVLDQ